MTHKDTRQAWETVRRAQADLTAALDGMAAELNQSDYINEVVGSVNTMRAGDVLVQRDDLWSLLEDAIAEMRDIAPEMADKYESALISATGGIVQICGNCGAAIGHKRGCEWAAK